jgi:hypothetical protein
MLYEKKLGRVAQNRHKVEFSEACKTRKFVWLQQRLYIGGGWGWIFLYTKGVCCPTPIEYNTGRNIDQNISVS